MVLAALAVITQGCIKENASAQDMGKSFLGGAYGGSLTAPPPPLATAAPSAARWRATRLPCCMRLGKSVRKGRVDPCVRSRRGLSAARGSAEAEALEMAIDFCAR